MILAAAHSEIRRRRGVSLLELLVVVSLMGVLSSTVVMRYGRDIFGDFGARNDAHQLWLDLQLARRMAIRTGQVHSVVCDGPASGPWTGTKIVQGNSPNGPAVGESRRFPPEIHVSGTAAVIQFNFEGQAAQSHSIRLDGPNRSWSIQIVPLSGAITVKERP